MPERLTTLDASFLYLEEPHLDLGDHLRHVAVAPPGGPRQLADLIGELHSQQLDREKPLWQMNLIDGLQDGYQAILTKTHHAMLDGVGGMDLAMMLLDLEPDPPEIAPPDPSSTEEWPSPM